MQILLCDVSSLFWPAWHAMAKEELNAAFRVTVARCKEIMNEWRKPGAGGYDYVAWCCDAPPYKRLQIRSDYKAQRQQPDPRATAQCRQIEQWLRDQGELVWSCPGYEADDLLATACAQAPESVEAIDLYTGDKDMLQLVSARVNVLPTQRNSAVSRYDAAEVLEKYKVRPDQFGDFLALWGDTSDNIPGVKGIGPEKAAKLLNTVGDLDTIIAAAADIGDKRIPTVSLRGMINNQLRELHDSRRLVTLMTDAPIRFDELFEPRERKQLEIPDYPKDEPPPAGESVVDAEFAEVGEDDLPPEMGGPVANSQEPEPATEQPEPKPAGEPEPPKAEPRQEPPRASAPADEPAPESQEQAKQEEPAEPPAAKADTPKKVHVPQAAIVLPDVAPRQQWAMALEPRSMDQVLWLAHRAFNTGQYKSLKSVDDALVTILTGREMGLTSIASLRGIRLVEGNPFVMGQTLQGIVLRSGLAKYFVCTKTTAERAVYKTWRKGDPEGVEMEYTIEEARQAGLIFKFPSGEPNNWIKRPKTMLRWRCVAELARMVYPDLAAGVYVPGETIETTGEELRELEAEFEEAS